MRREGRHTDTSAALEAHRRDAAFLIGVIDVAACASATTYKQIVSVFFACIDSVATQ